MLLRGQPVDIPNYCFKTHSRLPETQRIYPAPIIILEGILVFQDPRIRELFDLKIFIQCDSDVALARRLVRDISERQRDMFEVLHRYHTFVKPDYNKFVLPMMKIVDFTVRSDVPNTKALDIIFEYLWNKFSVSRKNSLAASDNTDAVAGEGGAVAVQVRDCFSVHLTAALFEASVVEEARALKAVVKNFTRACWEHHEETICTATPHFFAFCHDEALAQVDKQCPGLIVALFLESQSVKLPSGCKVFFFVKAPKELIELKRRRNPSVFNEEELTALLTKYFNKYAQKKPGTSC